MGYAYIGLQRPPIRLTDARVRNACISNMWIVHYETMKVVAEWLHRRIEGTHDGCSCGLVVPLTPDQIMSDDPFEDADEASLPDAKTTDLNANLEIRSEEQPSTKRTESRQPSSKRNKLDDVSMLRSSKTAMQQKEMLEKIQELRYAKAPRETLLERKVQLDRLLRRDAAAKTTLSQQRQSCPVSADCTLRKPTANVGNQSADSGDAAALERIDDDVVDLVSDDDGKSDEGNTNAAGMSGTGRRWPLSLCGDAPGVGPLDDVHLEPTVMTKETPRPVTVTHNCGRSLSNTFQVPRRFGVTEQHENAILSWPNARVPANNAASALRHSPPVPDGKSFADLYDIVLVIDNREQVTRASSGIIFAVLFVSQ